MRAVFQKTVTVEVEIPSGIHLSDPSSAEMWAREAEKHAPISSRPGAVASETPWKLVSSNMPLRPKTHEDLRAWRARLSLTQEGAADLLGFTVRHYKRLEAGQSPLSPSTAIHAQSLEASILQSAGA